MSMFKKHDKLFILPPLSGAKSIRPRLLPPLKDPKPFFVADAGKIRLAGKGGTCGCPICNFEEGQRAMSKAKLTPQVLPSAVKGKDFASLHAQGRCKYWGSLKDEAASKHGSECFYCTASPERAQEIWHFDHDAGTMTVVDIVPVCKLCHMAINIADAEETKEFPAVVQHIGTVLGIKKPQVGELIREAYQTWEDLTQRPWTISYGAFAHFIHLPGNLPETSAFEKVAVLKDYQRVPSETYHVKYLHVKRDKTKIMVKGSYPVFILSGSMKAIDKIWSCASAQTVNGHLGAEAFASTRRESEGKPLLSQTGFITIVLDENDSKEQIEHTLNLLFKDVASSIVFTEGSLK